MAQFGARVILDCDRRRASSHRSASHHVGRKGAAEGCSIKERVWHKSQQPARADANLTLFERTTGNKDDLLAMFRLADVVEFLRSIKGFGQDTEVVRPQWLLEHLHQELRPACKHDD